MNTSELTLSKELEEKRQLAFKRAEDAFQNRDSPYFRDHEHYRWSIETINIKFQEKNDTI